MRLTRVRALALAVMLTLALAGVTLGTTASASSTGAYKVAIYTTIGTSQQGLVGHVFVQLRHDGTNDIFGKYPDGTWVFDTGAAIRDDGPDQWSYRITYEVSQQAWGHALGYLQHQREHPDRYRLLTDNCVSFAVHVAQAAGVTVPWYRNLLGVPEPTAFTFHLWAIGDGHRFHGGLVVRNPDHNQTASGAPDPPSPTPPCCDVHQILRVAASNPRRLARLLGFRYHVYHLRPGSLAASGAYRVEIEHTNVQHNLYAIRWGDGTGLLAEKPRTAGHRTVAFAHRYRTIPTKPLTVVIMQDGRVLEYVQPLRPAGRGSHSQVSVEPAPPPFHRYG